ncbi:hypothetical protein PCANB_000149 [Pneumocystis canis]|nr:hypothetical protein PCANB_000149 [Pneumocystis canis]
MPIFQKSNFTVRRRFTDFIFLYETLFFEFPTCCIPPLPNKHRLKYFKGDRFSTEFTMKRTKSLELFLQRLTMHPQLRRSPHLCQFLESQDWHAYVCNVILQNKTKHIHIGDVFEGITDVFLNAFTKINKPNLLFTDMKEKIDKLEYGLTHIESLISKMIRHEMSLELDYENMASLFKKLALLEPSLDQELTMFSEAIKNMKSNIKTLREYTDYIFLTFLHDLISYSNTQKQLLKQRDQKQMDIEGLSEYLMKINTEKEQIIHGTGFLYLREKVESLTGINQEQSKQDRLKKLEKKNDELQREIEISKQANLSAIFLQQDSLKSLGLNAHTTHKETNHGRSSSDLQKDIFCSGNNTPTTLSFEPKQSLLPSLEIWAKKIFYQSDDLQKLVQMNAERYLERHEQLETLIKTLRSDFYTWLESAREEHKSRESEIIEKQESFRRICDIISDIIKANECKIHKLELMVENLSSVIMAQNKKIASFEAKQSEYMKSIHSTMNQILNSIHQLQTDHNNTNLSPEKHDITKNSSPLLIKSDARKRILLTSDELDEIEETMIEPREERKHVTPVRKIINGKVHSKKV